MQPINIKSQPKISPQSLEDFLVRQGLVHGQWDLLLFGDGSGLQWTTPGGFAVVLVDGRNGLRSHIVGAQSFTTLNRMELSAYVQALAYHHEFLMDGRITDPPYRTFIFTDSEFTVKAGRRLVTVKKNLDLWQLVNWYEPQGYRFHWRWVPRNSTPYHELTDYLAGTARHVIKSMNISGDKLHDMMPYSPQLVNDVELVKCPVCETPLASEDSDCPVCGPAKKGDCSVERQI